MIRGSVSPLAVSVTPPPSNLLQGVQVIDGAAAMLEEGDNRWVYIAGSDILYLTEDSEVIIYH